MRQRTLTGFQGIEFMEKEMNSGSTENNIFIKKTEVGASAEKSFAWHERPGALQRLTPPWQKMRVEKQDRGIMKGSRVRMKSRFFALPVTLEAEHTAYEKGRFFQDRLIKGPFASWIHTHSFADAGEGRSILEDRIDFRLPWYFPGFVRKMINRELGRIFRHRHDIFKRDISRHSQAERPLTILISGASGLLGSALVPFFTTGGHRVFPLVRREPDYEKNERYWNPETGEVDLSGIGPIDVVINLNGAPLADGRWTEKRKRLIIDSRVKTTEFLAETIASLPDKPGLFFSASAIGYYIGGGDYEVDEESGAGTFFISDVCRLWEEASQKASRAGIRTVSGRMGVVLAPDGGALGQMLPAFSKGLGVRFGSGSQLMSWISLEDTIGAIWHIIMNRDISGPVNITGPDPVTNRKFTSILGRILKRPAYFVMPAVMIRFLWGKMGEELLLNGAKVKPEKLNRSGYSFCHRDIESALRAAKGLFKKGGLGTP